jgi:2-polyprenyl-6-methoxyphenol hydroxylase-like FAD-dependent oxidoreductase
LVQFHLNGFEPGDPDISDRSQRYPASGCPGSLPEEVDVLIVGCGPAGLTLAAQLSAFPDIKTCIVEQKPGPLRRGQADGIACRTIEMFQAYGFAERVVVLNQARVHDFYLEVMRKSPAALVPYYARRLINLEIDDAALGDNSNPCQVTARLERLAPEHDAQTETIRARYVVGCDGAHSTVRKSIVRALNGDSANHAWGVMDVLAVTDFPDVRFKSLIQSAGDGSIMVIPREGGYLFRLYIELEELGAGERISNRNITADDLIATARRILQPYTLDVKEVPWWSVYEIGQRLCDKFDDVPEKEVPKRLPRVFIAGDACHTHSPKAGQGMNVSMQDGFNLGWKLASVLHKRCAPDLLHSYSAERQAIAKELIDFDREWAEMIASSKGFNPDETQNYFVRHGRYTAGTAAHYRPSLITGDATHQHLADGMTIGMRFHSAPVIRLADAKRVELGHTVRADGRWRVFAFTGAKDPTATTSGIYALCDFLSDARESPVRKFTAEGEDIDAVIDVRAVFQQAHADIAIEMMPSLLLPQKGKFGLRDYEKVFCTDLKSGQDIFAMRGIDRERGCMVVVRPDQYVAHVLPLDGYLHLAAFFDKFMTRPSMGEVHKEAG